MELRILGPLEVEHDGIAVTVAGRHQPRLLAALALAHRRTVPIPTLVEVLWDGFPPSTARRQVQNLMARLRRDLAEAGRDPITSTADGYRLDADRVDIEDFDRLSRQGRDASRTGDAARAATVLRQALALWRGPALAGLSGRYLEAAATRLDEERLAAVEERIDADLASGHGRDLVAELAGLVAAHPYRQRLAGQAMTALHQAQRTVEALELFRDLRTRLADDLGIDPGADLRALYTAILRDELPAPGGAAGREAGPETVVPEQLPVDVGGFTGRHAQLRMLDEVADGPGRLAVVSGIGGVGKTALAIHWGWSRGERFPDGKLYINLRGYDPMEPLSPKAALDALLRGLGLSGDRIPTDPDETAALFRSLTAHRRILVVLDNAANAEQVRPLLPAGGTAVTLVTGRDRFISLIAGHHARSITLDPLSPDESVALMSTVSRRPDSAADLPRIAELCGRLPLALRIAAAQLAAQPMRTAAEFATELASPDRLDALAIDGDPDADVAAGFDLSFQRLDADTARLLLLLASVPGDDVPESLAVAVDGRPARAVVRTLRRLESACLLEQHHPRRYRLHDLVRDYARRLGDDRFTAAEHDAAADAVIEWFVVNRNEMDPANIDNLVAAVHAYAPGYRYWRLSSVLFRFSALGLRVNLALELLAGMAEVCDREGDAQDRARVHDALGWTNWFAGNHAATVEACRKALDVTRSIGDRFLLNRRLSNLAVALSEYGRLREALEHSRELLASVDDFDAGDHRVNVFLNHGARLSRVGRYDEAEPYLRKAMELEREREDTRLSIPCVLILSALYLHTERYEEARRCLAHLSTDLEMRADHMLRLHHCIIAAFHDGEPIRAVAELHRLRHEANLANTGLMGHETGLTLAAILLDQGDTDTAAEVLAELSAEPHPGLVVTAWTRCLTARLSLATGSADTARDIATATAPMFAEMPHPRGEAACWRVVAETHTALGDPEAARRAARRADDITIALGVPVSARTFYF